MSPVAERLRRLLVRTGRGPLRSVYTFAYELVARAVGAYVRRGHRDAAVYATSSLATGELVPGVSDLDLGVVVGRNGTPGAARRALEARRDRLWRLVPPLGRYVWVGVYEDDELDRAQAVSLAPPAVPDETLFFGERKLADDLNLSSRPGFPGRVHTWRLLAGAERRRDRRPRTREEDRLAAWLELQSWWQWAVQACLDPDTPGRASLCVKLVAEPCRILLWLEHGEELPTRRRVLGRAVTLLPDERDAIADALTLRDELTRSPKAPVDRFLPVFVRLTVRIATLLANELSGLGSTPVRLEWGGPDELALGGRSLAQLETVVPGKRAAVLPLADWRGIVAPTLPDECLVEVEGDPGNPAAVAAAAGASSPVVYAALRAHNLLVLPTTDVYWLGAHRSVHFAGSDPVSFALLEGASVARFPDHLGLSVGDVAARAVAEHRAYLARDLHEPGWPVQKLGVVLNAARSALLAESAAAGEPVLPLTVAATARLLAERLPDARGLAEEAAGMYLQQRREGKGAVAPLVEPLASAVRSLPVYGDPYADAARRRPEDEERVSVT